MKNFKKAQVFKNKSTKNSWSKEEVIEFGNKIRQYCKDGWKQDSLHRVFFEWDKYVNENL